MNIYREGFTPLPVREKQVLAYTAGGELRVDVILDTTLCTAYTWEDPVGCQHTQEIYWAGQILAPILTAAMGGTVGRYSYYDPAATDGRGNTGGVAPDDMVVLIKDTNVHFGDTAAGAYKSWAAFNIAQLIGYAGNEAAVQAAMALCEFLSLHRQVT